MATEAKDGNKLGCYARGTADMQMLPVIGKVRRQSQLLGLGRRGPLDVIRSGGWACFRRKLCLTCAGWLQQDELFGWSGSRVYSERCAGHSALPVRARPLSR